jgi:uncharacterized protein YecT (DUF1311 family)
MNNNCFSKYLLLSLLGFSTAAMAKNTIEMCEANMKTVDEVSHCLDGIKKNKDRELQTWVNNQTFILQELANNSGRSSSLNIFKRSQLNFIRYREDNCRWQYLVLAPDAGAAVAYKKCYNTLTQYRIEELTQLNK